MKVVQTTLDDAEYQLLKKMAKEKKKTIKELVREAIRRLIEEDRIDPQDPIFTKSLLVVEKGRSEKTSEEHDKVLYEI
ncbi:MAG: ribbon-helix-helix protein, CopG family [Candidatus Asgardarchaeia archaeon]